MWDYYFLLDPLHLVTRKQNYKYKTFLSILFHKIYNLATSKSRSTSQESGRSASMTSDIDLDLLFAVSFSSIIDSSLLGAMLSLPTLLLTEGLLFCMTLDIFLSFPTKPAVPCFSLVPTTSLAEDSLWPRRYN